VAGSCGRSVEGEAAYLVRERCGDSMEIRRDSVEMQWRFVEIEGLID